MSAIFMTVGALVTVCVLVVGALYILKNVRLKDDIDND